MKISTKGKYGLRAIVYIGAAKENRVSLKEIAEKEQISLKYLEQIFSILKKAEIVESVKGTMGGYFLSQKGLKMNIFEVLKILEGEERVSEENKGNLTNIEYTINSMVWEKIDNTLKEILEAVTVENIIERYQGNGASMFYI